MVILQLSSCQCLIFLEKKRVPNLDILGYLLFEKMIFEHQTKHAKSNIKQVVKFNYISPTIHTASTLTHYHPHIVTPPQPISFPHPFFQFTKKEMQSGPQIQRKRIFDRSYSSKSTILAKNNKEKSLEPSRQQMRNKIGNYSQTLKKSRKNIFPKMKKSQNDFGTFTQDENRASLLSSQIYQHDQGVKLKPPSTLTCYVNIDHLRKQAKNQICRNPLTKEHQDQQYIQRSQQYNYFRDENTPSEPSEVKVDLNHSYQTNKSIKCQYMLPEATEERFYDKDSMDVSPKRVEKFSEVELFSTMNEQFRRTPTLEPSYLEKIKNYLESHQLKSSLLPFMLIIMGLFLLLVQASN